MSKWHIPAALERILACLNAEEEPLSWNISKSFEGQFSLRIWISKEASVPAKNSHKGNRESNKHQHPQPVSSPTNVDTNTDSNVKEAVILDNKRPESTVKRKKSPSKIRRDKERRSLWSRKKKLSRQNQRATEKLDEQSDSSTTSVSQTPNSSPELLDTTQLVLESGGTREIITLQEPTERRDLFQLSLECSSIHPDNSTSSVPVLLDSSVAIGNRGTPISYSKPSGEHKQSEACAHTSNSVPVKSARGCVICGKPCCNLCNKCRAVKYCGPKCQKEHQQSQLCAIYCAQMSRFHNLTV